METKTAIVPTMPSRTEWLRYTIASIIGQVDMLYVFLNDFTHIPDYLLGNEKIVCISSIDWGSAGRFFMADKVNGYYFMLDDDLIYPPDYIEKMIEKIEQYERRAVITLHGRILKQPLDNWFTGQEVICRCLHDWPDDMEIHVGGTGVMGYHADTIKIKLSEFKNRNLDDVEFSIFAQAQKVPIVAVNHERGFLGYQEGVHKVHTIWSETVKNPEPLLTLAQSIEWKLYGIETLNKGIILKAHEIKPEKIKQSKDVSPAIEKELKITWKEKMSNLMQRRKDRKGKTRLKSQEPISQYDLHVRKIEVGKKVLDVGCGSMIIKGFLPPETDYTGIDAYPVNADVVKMEIERCTYPELYFDTTFAFAVLDSVYNLHWALKKIAKVTKTNILILTGLDIAPNKYHTFKVTEAILNDELTGFRQGYKEYFGKTVALIEYIRF